MPRVYHPSQQSYNVVYNDTISTTLEDAFVTLDTVPHSILRYTQHIYPGKSTYPFIIHKPENDLLYFSFPRECIYVTNVKNTAHCKMIMECMEKDEHDNCNEYLKEIHVMPEMYLSPNTNVCVYLRNKPTRISFDVLLCKIRSKL